MRRMKIRAIPNVGSGSSQRITQPRKKPPAAGSSQESGAERHGQPVSEGADTMTPLVKSEVSSQPTTSKVSELVSDITGSLKRERCDSKDPPLAEDRGSGIINLRDAEIKIDTQQRRSPVQFSMESHVKAGFTRGYSPSGEENASKEIILDEKSKAQKNVLETDDEVQEVSECDNISEILEVQESLLPSGSGHYLSVSSTTGEMKEKEEVSTYHLEKSEVILVDEKVGSSESGIVKKPVGGLTIRRPRIHAKPSLFGVAVKKTECRSKDVVLDEEEKVPAVSNQEKVTSASSGASLRRPKLRAKPSLFGNVGKRAQSQAKGKSSVPLTLVRDVEMKEKADAPVTTVTDVNPEEVILDEDDSSRSEICPQELRPLSSGDIVKYHGNTSKASLGSIDWNLIKLPGKGNSCDSGEKVEEVRLEDEKNSDVTIVADKVSFTKSTSAVTVVANKVSYTKSSSTVTVVADQVSLTNRSEVSVVEDNASFTKSSDITVVMDDVSLTKNSDVTVVAEKVSGKISDVTAIADKVSPTNSTEVTVVDKVSLTKGSEVTVVADKVSHMPSEGNTRRPKIRAKPSIPFAVGRKSQNGARDRTAGSHMKKVISNKGRLGEGENSTPVTIDVETSTLQTSEKETSSVIIDEGVTTSTSVSDVGKLSSKPVVSTSVIIDEGVTTSTSVSNVGKLLSKPVVPTSVIIDEGVATSISVSNAGKHSKPVESTSVIIDVGVTTSTSFSNVVKPSNKPVGSNIRRPRIHAKPSIRGSLGRKSDSQVRVEPKRTEVEIIKLEVESGNNSLDDFHSTERILPSSVEKVHCSKAPETSSSDVQEEVARETSLSNVQEELVLETSSSNVQDVVVPETSLSNMQEEVVQEDGKCGLSNMQEEVVQEDGKRGSECVVNTEKTPSIPGGSAFRRPRIVAKPSFMGSSGKKTVVHAKAEVHTHDSKNNDSDKDDNPVSLIETENITAASAGNLRRSKFRARPALNAKRKAPVLPAKDIKSEFSKDDCVVNGREGQEVASRIPAEKVLEEREKEKVVEERENERVVEKRENEKIVEKRENEKVVEKKENEKVVEKREREKIVEEKEIDKGHIDDCQSRTVESGKDARDKESVSTQVSVRKNKSTGKGRQEPVIDSDTRITSKRKSQVSQRSKLKLDSPEGVNSDDSGGDKENSSKRLSSIKVARRERSTKEKGKLSTHSRSKAKTVQSDNLVKKTKLKSEAKLKSVNGDTEDESEESKRIFRERKEKYRKKLSQSQGNIERGQMTMFDLIFWNPLTNPMPGRTDTPKKKDSNSGPDNDADDASSDIVEEQMVDDLGLEVKSVTEESRPTSPSSVKELSMGDEPSQSPKPSQGDERGEEETAKEEDKGEEETCKDIFAPQVKIGPNGQIILDEQSIKIQTTAAKNRDEILSKAEVVEESNDSAHYGKWSKKRRRSCEWTVKETARFYKALSTVGTDFSLMETLFTWRSRAELKTKFKKEERTNRELVDRALKDCTQFDLTLFDDESDYDPEEDRKASRIADRAEAKRRRLEMKQSQKEEEKLRKKLLRKEEKAKVMERKAVLRKMRTNLKSKRKAKEIANPEEETDYDNLGLDLSDSDVEFEHSVKSTLQSDQKPAIKRPQRKKRVVKKESKPRKSNSPLIISEVTVTMETVKYEHQGQSSVPVVEMTIDEMAVRESAHQPAEVTIDESAVRESAYHPADASSEEMAIEENPCDDLMLPNVSSEISIDESFANEILASSSNPVLSDIAAANDPKEDGTSDRVIVVGDGGMAEKEEKLWHLPVSAIQTNSDGSQTVTIPTDAGERIVPVPHLPPGTSNVLVVGTKVPQTDGEYIYHVYTVSPVAS